MKGLIEIVSDLMDNGEVELSLDEADMLYQAIDTGMFDTDQIDVEELRTATISCDSRVLVYFA